MEEQPVLRRGVMTDYALQVLRELVTDARNLASSGGRQPESYRDDYLMWAEKAETQLSHLFVSRSVWSGLFTQRYWHLRGLTLADTPRPHRLISMEAEWQATRLEMIVGWITEVVKAFETSAGTATVAVDTNVFIHFRRYDEINWPKLAGTTDVRLVVPLLVVDQLEELSYKSRATSDRATRILRALQDLRRNHRPEISLEVRSGTTLQILMDPRGHSRHPDSDAEFLDRVEFLAAIGAGRVLIATGDYGMKLRATARGLNCIDLPEDLRLKSPP